MKISKRIGTLGAAVGLLCGSATAEAHGVWGHVQVTAWAIDNLPPGDLRDMFRDHDVFNAALFGAGFTDSGYSPGNIPREDDEWRTLVSKASAYSEHTHWEGFIQQYVEWISENDPPPYDHLGPAERLESEKRLAFLLGCAAHGLQDEIFDSLFLLQTQRHDSAGQSEVDPASDGFLGVDGYARFIPEPYIPFDTVLEIYADAGMDTTREVIQQSIDLFMVYLSEGGRMRHTLMAEEAEDRVPWTRAHYMDTSIPGSLRSEIVPTGRYMQAIWDRLHRPELDPEEVAAYDVVVHTYPEAPRRLLGTDASTPDPWVTLILGEGMAIGSITPSWTERDGDKSDVSFALAGTRWGANHTRLISFRPSEPLTPGKWYTAGIAAGAELIGGAQSEAFSFEFQAPCATADDAVCPDLGEIPEPSIDGEWPAKTEDPPPDDVNPAVPDDSETDPTDPPATPAATPAASDSGCAVSVSASANSNSNSNSTEAAVSRASGMLTLGLLGALAVVRRRRRRRA